MTRFVVVGSLNFDIISRVKGLPRRHEKVTALEMSLCPGGSAANTAYWLARDGADVCIVGAVGDDSFGQDCIQSLQQVGVDTSAVVIVPQARTGLATVWVTARDKRMITVQGPPTDHALGSFDTSNLGTSDIIHVAARPSQALLDLCNRAVDTGARISLEFNGRTMDELRPMITTGFMNADELKRAVGVEWKTLTPRVAHSSSSQRLVVS